MFVLTILIVVGGLFIAKSGDALSPKSSVVEQQAPTAVSFSEALQGALEKGLFSQFFGTQQTFKVIEIAHQEEQVYFAVKREKMDQENVFFEVTYFEIVGLRVIEKQRKFSVFILDSEGYIRSEEGIFLNLETVQDEFF